MSLCHVIFKDFNGQNLALNAIVKKSFENKVLFSSQKGISNHNVSGDNSKAQA